MCVQRNATCISIYIYIYVIFSYMYTCVNAGGFMRVRNAVPTYVKRHCLDMCVCMSVCVS